MDIPAGDEVGWYQHGAAPGERGSAVLAAHIASDGRDGVFRRLADVTAGAAVEVGLEDGTVRTFQVVAVRQYPKSQLPTVELFAKDGEPVLALVSCGGRFDPATGHYEDNIVAYAVPA